MAADGVTRVTKLSEAAAHEAGHCVCVLDHHGRVEQVVVDDDGNGHTHWSLAWERRAPASDLLRVSEAGFLAAQMLTGRECWPSPSDAALGERALRQLGWTMHDAQHRRHREQSRSWCHRHKDVIACLASHLVQHKRLDADQLLALCRDPSSLLHRYHRDT